jgi:parallel beta-helix repeat protein
MPGSFMPQPGGTVPITPQPETVAPAAPAAPPQSPGPQGSDTHLLEKKSRKLTFIAIAIVVMLAVVAVAYIKVIYHAPQTTTSSTTTIATVTQASISGCRSISSPGNYTFTGNISTSIASGACISVNSSNVNIDCKGYSLRGSGPYSGVPPFSYGMMITGNNVGLAYCSISNFSYGVYATPVAGLSIHDNNISSNYVSDLYLNNVQGAGVYKNTLLAASGSQGSLYLTNGSSNNRIYNNTVNNYVNYGVNVNSTGNLFYDNNVNGNPSGFYCSALGGLSKSNTAYGNRCLNNTGCSFVSCSGSNLLTNLSSITLTSSISGCGSITSPGVYTLTGRIDMAQFINISNPLASGRGAACIYIRSGSVVLNCAGMQIINATTAIIAAGKSNVTINNCPVSARYYGIVLNNVSDSKIYNTSVRGGIYGILLNSSSVNFLTNVIVAGSEYGLSIRNASTDTVNRFSLNNNTYGLYLSNSLGNIFSNGQAVNNSDIDVYATPNSANASYNFMSTTVCGLTNAAWASCKTHVSTSLQYTPVNSCGTLSRPGNYLLTGSISTLAQDCFTIAASNVKLGCAGNHIGSSTATSSGYAISIDNEVNVTVSNCILSNFAFGVVATNSMVINIANVVDHHSKTGVSFNRVSSSQVLYSAFDNTTGAGINVSGSSNDALLHNNISYEYGPGSGIIIRNSTHNNIENNSGYSNYDGVSLLGASQNNTVSNNNMFGSDYYDYACTPLNNPINAEYGGINYGGNRQGCNWLAVIPISYSGLSCIVSHASNYISLSTDQYYKDYSTCISVYSNSTTLDCHGHSIIATNNGTLMYLHGSSGSVIENCWLRGFSQVAQAQKGGVSLINDTIYSNSSVAQYGALVNVSGGSNIQLSDNNITAAYYAVSVANTKFGTISNNRVASGAVAYSLYNASGLRIYNNLAVGGSGIGLILNGSTANNFQNNKFNGTVIGMQCTGRSTSSSSDTDLGGNSCSSQYQCAWISSSSSTCH